MAQSWYPCKAFQNVPCDEIFVYCFLHVAATWRWRHKYVLPVRSNATFIYQFIVGTSIIFYALNYKKFCEYICASLLKLMIGVNFL